MTDTTEALPPHPSHATVRDWMPVAEALRLADLWTVGDLDNSGQWRAAIKVLADEVRAALAQRQQVPEVTPFNVGRWCMSEYDCLEAGFDFGAYERGVMDAAKAFERNKR